MPILYIHGVATRSRDGFFAIKSYLQRLVAPAISADPDGVLIDDVFWGDVAATFAWEGPSQPKSRLLGMGAEAEPLSPIEGALTAAAFTDAFKRLPAAPAAAPPTGGLISGGAMPARPASASVRPQELSPEALSDLLA